MGIKTLPEVVNSTTKKSVESAFSSIGEKINDQIQYVEGKLKDGFDSLKSTPAPGESEPLLDESERNMDMSDEEFEQKQADVSENSSSKKARKDQDLIDARRRGLGKGKKT